MLEGWIFGFVINEYITNDLCLIAAQETPEKIRTSASNYSMHTQTEIGFDVPVTVHPDTFLIKNPTRCTNFSNLFLEIKLYMFRAVPLSIIRSFSL